MSDRIWQEFYCNDCFAGDTKFLTSQGVRQLGDACGETLMVLGKSRGWTSAKISSFGKQNVIELVLKRYNQEKIIHTTAGHRWFVRNKKTDRLPFKTHELKPGQRLFSMYGRLHSCVRPSAFGIAQGIVFGDGTFPRTTKGPGSVALYGEKDRELLKWFPLSPTKPIRKPKGIRVSDLPRSWKEPPDLNESKSFLYGWLAGYFAADGSTGSQYVIHSANRLNLELVKSVALRLGIGYGQIHMDMREGFGDGESPIYKIALEASTLREDFFLIPKHKQSFLNVSWRRRPAEWEVAEIVPTSRKEEVFCATVPDGHVFTLDQNILTGNCDGYFRVKLNMAINCSVEMTCPECGRKHPRRIEKGRIYEGGGGSTKEEIRPPKSAYSKEPLSSKIRKNERQGVVLDSEKIGNNFLRESWLEKHGG